MENIRQGLIQLFDEMLEQIKQFKKKTYGDIFKDSFEKHRPTVAAMAAHCAEAPEKDRDSVIEEIANIIPDYAYEKIQKLSSKNKRERASVDYNMNMAVYVVPMITYTHDEYCQKIADRMVEIWNEKKVTSLTLGKSSYDDIAGGFKKGFCFITTAVCEHMDKPDDCYELTTLRGYRDSYLMQTEEGRRLVEEYYDTAPGIVKVLEMQPDAPDIYDRLYKSYLNPCIRYIEDGENEKCRTLYEDMVHTLQKKYLYS